MSASPPPSGVAPRPTIHHASESDTVKVLLATDCHLGVHERDPIRGQDSINTFREILELAVRNEVDMILMAGDLFHENRPSRDTLFQTLALLREYTMGDRPIELELLSDPDDGKAPSYSFPAINYEDPNLNVSIPTFSIHGNHDDPQGAGPEGALGALDILSAAGLVNYMGKFDLPLAPGGDKAPAPDTQNGIIIRPVLLRKGATRIGLYGVGNVKDARMHFELRSNRVKMFMPKDKDEWFNILLVHQNRVKRGPQEAVPEGMFDDAIDLVMWGHEHDCRIDPEPVPGKRYYITQPGSSVATSLADGEAIEKHVAVLTICKREFEMRNIPLRTVRPFVIEDVHLLDASDEENFDPKNQMAVAKFLRSRAEALIDKANQLWDDRQEAAASAGEREIERMLPLVRLKVDTTGVTDMSNPVRFGHEFSGRLANPRDVLVFHRSAARKSTATGNKGRGKPAIPEEVLMDEDDEGLSAAEKLGRVRVQNLVREYLEKQELQLLGEAGMGDAIETFVDKDDPHAITTHVNHTLKKMLKDIQAKSKPEEDMDEDVFDDVLTQAREKEADQYAAAKEAKAAAKAKGKGKAKAQDSDAESVDSMLMDIDGGEGEGVGGNDDGDFEDEAPPPPKKRAPTKTTAKAPAKAKAAPAKKAPARGKKRIEEDEDDDDDDDDDVVEVVEEAPKKRTNRAAVLSQPAPKARTAKKAATPAAASQSTLKFAPAGRTRAPRAAAAASRSKTRDDVEEIESD